MSSGGTGIFWMTCKIKSWTSHGSIHKYLAVVFRQASDSSFPRGILSFCGYFSWVQNCFADFSHQLPLLCVAKNRAEDPSADKWGLFSGFHVGILCRAWF